MKTIKNLVLRGGGVPATIAYPGALQELDDRHLLDSLETITGTSAGAIIACLMALGMKPRQMEDLILNTDFSLFADNQFGMVRDVFRLIKNLGWNKGTFFEDWLKNVIEDLTEDENYTFGDLAKNSKYELFIPATLMTSKGFKCKVLCCKNSEDIPIWQAVRASMAIPLFYEPVTMHNGKWADGGESYNYPINIKDENSIVNWDTLGLSVGTRQEVELCDDLFDLSEIKDSNFDISLMQSIALHVEFMLSQSNKTYIKPDDWKRTVFIDRGNMKATAFKVTKAEKLKLLEAGRIGVREYLIEKV